MSTLAFSLLGVELLDPWLLGLAPVGILVWLWRRRSARAALPAASLGLFAALPRSLRARFVWLPGVLTLLGSIALVAALARPVTREAMPIRQFGVDIMLLIDISSSMSDEDMEDEARRIDVAREQAIEFARGRSQDRVGLMTFALFPELRCPLTLDQRALVAFLRGVDIVRNNVEDSTAIGAGLGHAVQFLENSDARSKVVVLLSDGEERVNRIAPADAAKLAADAGIRVHTIGFGTGQLIPMPFGRATRQSLEFEALREIADTTGGRFYPATTAEQLAAVYAEIDALERSELEDPRYRTSDQFAWPLLVGVLLCAAALLLEVLWIRGVP